MTRTYTCETITYYSVNYIRHRVIMHLNIGVNKTVELKGEIIWLLLELYVCAWELVEGCVLPGISCIMEEERQTPEWPGHYLSGGVNV